MQQSLKSLSCTATKDSERIFLSSVNASREAFRKLKEYERILLDWNTKINLISNSTESNIWIKHFLDSAQLYEYVKSSNSILDVGSGAGFPGIVLGILGVKQVTLVEKNTKKCAFLNYVSSCLDLDIKVINECVEKLDIETDFITSRAVTDAFTMVEITKNVRCHSILLLKSRNIDAELEKIKKMTYKVYEGIEITNSVIVEIKREI